MRWRRPRRNYRTYPHHTTLTLVNGGREKKARRKPRFSARSGRIRETSVTGVLLNRDLPAVRLGDLRERKLQHAVDVLRLCRVGVDRFRQTDRTRGLAEPAFAPKRLAVRFDFLGVFDADGHVTVLDLDFDLVLRDTRDFRLHDIGFRGFDDVQLDRAAAHAVDGCEERLEYPIQRALITQQTGHAFLSLNSLGRHRFAADATKMAVAIGISRGRSRAPAYPARSAARMPCRSAVGAGGQPGISTSTGITLATRPRLPAGSPQMAP